MKEQLATLHNALLQKTEIEGLAFLAEQFPNEIVFSTSFGLEDQAVTHLILANQIHISIFTLDTGRLFNETYSVWESTDERYNAHILSYYPKTTDIEEYVHKNGPLSFYHSVELRRDTRRTPFRGRRTSSPGSRRSGHRPKRAAVPSGTAGQSPTPRRRFSSSPQRPAADRGP